MRILILFILSITILSCSNKVKEKNYNSNDPEIIATSFHNWYLDQVDYYFGDVPYEIEITKGENQMCLLNFDSYITDLRAIGTISEKFIDSERSRLNNCVDNYSDITWHEYYYSDAYLLNDLCDKLKPFYFIRFEYPDIEVRITETIKENEDLVFVVKFYDNETKYWNEYVSKVRLENENEKFLITDIDWIK